MAAPRLEQFQAVNPDIDIRLSSSLGIVDFQQDNFDAAVRLGRGQYPSLEAVKLFDESLTPMCSPRLEPLAEPDGLQHQVLLHDDSMRFDPETPTWRTWLHAAGAHQVDSTRGPRFSQPDHAIQAAIDGAGVALGWQYLAADDIAAGRLIAPFSLRLPLGSAFYLVYPEAYADRPKVVKFRAWLLHETRRNR